jgi:hypothetical protein
MCTSSTAPAELTLAHSNSNGQAQPSAEKTETTATDDAILDVLAKFVLRTKKQQRMERNYNAVLSMRCVYKDVARN